MNKTLLFEEINAAITQLTGLISLHECKGLTNDEYNKLFNKISDFADKGPRKNRENLHEKELFEFFKEKIRVFLQATQDKLSKLAGIQYLEEFVSCSNNYTYFSGWLKRLFRYLDNFYLKHKKDLAWEIFETFKQNFLQNVQYEVFNEVFSLLDKEREGFDSNKPLILRVVQFYFLMCYDKNIALDYNKEMNQFVFSGINEKEDYQFYRSNFEAKLLENIKNFYFNKISNKWLTESSADFQVQALEALKREKNMALTYYPISQENIREVLKKTLIEDYYLQVLDNPKTGLRQMLLNHSEKDLKNCYDLYKNVDFILKDKIAIIFKEFLELQASKICSIPITNLRSAQEIVQCFDAFVALKKDIEIKVEFFNNFLEIQKIIDDCFFMFFRTDEAARYLAVYFDLNLRKLQRIKNDQDSDSQYLIKLFKYLSSRDEFFETYKKKLISRILDEIIKSFDHEKNYLSKLKKECGILSTIMNCESLLQDTEIISKTLTKSFKESLKTHACEPPFDFEIKILEKSCYISQKKPQSFEFVHELQPIVAEFQNFYKEINQNRIVEFIYQDGISEIYFNNKKKYRLVVFNDCLPILLLFNQQKSVETYDLLIKTGLNEKVLEERLKVLEKSQILLKENDRFSVNFEFKSEKQVHELHRLKITKEKNEENGVKSAENEQFDEVKIKRQNILDASLVRLMKSRITMNYNDLMSDCTKLVQNTFKPDIKMIRNRIESLLERGYICRDENDKKILKYLS